MVHGSAVSRLLTTCGPAASQMRRWPDKSPELVRQEGHAGGEGPGPPYEPEARGRIGSAGRTRGIIVWERPIVSTLGRVAFRGRGPRAPFPRPAHFGTPPRSPR